MKLKHIMLLAAATLAIATGGASAQQYPDKSVRIVVAYPPGGATDILARLVADGLTKKFGQTFVVENKPGGATMIGASEVANAAPDGYTLFLANAVTSTAMILQKDATVSLDNFVAVAPVAKAPNVLEVGVDVASSLDELITKAKAEPGSMNYAALGAGSILHILGEAFKGAAGIDAEAIHYKGSAPAIQALLGGEIEYLFDAVPTVLPLVRDNQSKVLAVTSDQRLAVLPDTPTFAELGYPALTSFTWNGVLAPKGTPADIVAKVNAAVGEIVESKDVTDRLLADGATPMKMTPEEYQAYIEGDFTAWKERIEPLHIEMN